MRNEAEHSFRYALLFMELLAITKTQTIEHLIRINCGL